MVKIVNLMLCGGFFFFNIVANKNKLKKERIIHQRFFCDLKYERALQSSLSIRKSDENVIVDMEDLCSQRTSRMPSLCLSVLQGMES